MRNVIYVVSNVWVGNVWLKYLCPDQFDVISLLRVSDMLVVSWCKQNV